jgi:hypothetical protein
MSSTYPPLPYRASPPQGGRSARSENFVQSAASVMGETLLQSISRLEGEMPGRAEGGVTPSSITEATR